MLDEHTECQVLCITEHWKSDDQLKIISINYFKLKSWFCREERKHIAANLSGNIFSKKSEVLSGQSIE